MYLIFYRHNDHCALDKIRNGEKHWLQMYRPGSLRDGHTDRKEQSGMGREVLRCLEVSEVYRKTT